MIKCLNLDSGGIRGVVSLKILEKVSKFLDIKSFDVYCGCSTGAIIIIGILLNFSLDDMIEKYKLFSEKYFHSRRILYQFRAKYSLKDSDITYLSNLLNIDKNATISELPKRIIVPVVSLNHNKKWKLMFIDNFDETQKNITIMDLLLRTISAPTYFPSYDGYIDGAVVLKESTFAYFLNKSNQNNNFNLKEIKFLSIGTGYKNYYIDGDVDWGIFQWIFSGNYESGKSPLFYLFFDLNKKMQIDLMKNILKNNYIRIDLELDKKVELDDYSQIEYLIQKTLQYLSSEKYKNIENELKTF